jgi:uncharacterized protein (TIGR02246 family)
MSAEAAAIAAVGEALDRALVSGDPDVVASYFTVDAVLGESGMHDVVGRRPIRDFLAAANLKRTVTGHVLHQQEVLSLGPGRALELAWFEETKELPGQPPIKEWGRVVTFWRREGDGAWRVERMVISDLPGPWK